MSQCEAFAARSASGAAEKGAAGGVFLVWAGVRVSGVQWKLDVRQQCMPGCRYVVITQQHTSHDNRWVGVVA
jgi:hypothetical protein